MKLHRLVDETEDEATAIDFHQRLTLLWSTAPERRARALDQILLAMGPGRPGLHLELVDADNRHVVAFRPAGAPACVIGLADAADLSATYTVPDGRIDLVARAGLDGATLRRLAVLTAADLQGDDRTGTDDDALARALGSIDPATLWPAAERASAAEDRRRATSNEAGADLDEVATFERIEELHVRAEQVSTAHRRLFRFGVTVSAICLALAGAVLFVDRWTANGLAVLGVAAFVLSVVNRRHVVVARRRERRALAEAGAVDFAHFRGLAGPLARAEVRTDLLSADRELVSARNEWASITAGAGIEGDVSWDWALLNRTAIERLGRPREATERIGDRLVELREVGSTKEPLPLVAFDALTGLDVQDRNRVLDALVRLSQRHQIVVISAEESVRRSLADAAATGDALIVDLDAPVATMIATAS